MQGDWWGEGGRLCCRDLSLVSGVDVLWTRGVWLFLQGVRELGGGSVGCHYGKCM